MILPIIKYGSPILRKFSYDIHEEDLPEQVSKNMFDTLKKDAGIGLAGPQIGLLKKIFIIDTTPLLEDDPLIKKVEQVYLNPQILDASNEKVIYNEGCLSIPGIYKDLYRSDKIRVRYQNLSFETIEEELDGMPARIFQHEYDHLEGILFIDKISALQRKLISGKLNKIRK
ncbi:MAG: peptide deformylase [Mangrovibacterium sp.]|nr:peptide deformylase [Mangrovibacterium sp.]